MKDFKLTDDPAYYQHKKREWYLKNKEKVAAQAKAWREAHPERYKEIQKAYQKHRRVSWIPPSKPEHRLVDGNCVICDRPAKRADVDGNLCSKCTKTIFAIRHLDKMRLKMGPFLRYLKREAL